MTGKVGVSGIPMQFVDDFNLLIDFPYIFGALVVGYLYMDISFHNEVAALTQLVQLILNTIQQFLQYESADNRSHEY